MKIEITGSYSEMTWYSNLIGKVFEVAEFHKDDVRVKNENPINSMWVYDGDFKIVE